MKYIELTQGKRATVDDEDFDFINRLNLTSNKGLILARFENSNKHIDIPVSHLILGRKVGGHLIVTYRDKNIFNIQKSNLLIMNGSHFVHSASNNYRNTPKTSKYRGVSFQKKGSRWKGAIQLNGVRYQNTFSTEEKAAEYYNRKARDLYGEDAYQNIISS